MARGSTGGAAEGLGPPGGSLQPERLAPSSLNRSRRWLCWRFGAGKAIGTEEMIPSHAPFALLHARAKTPRQ
eukprot:7690785-Pyramimonas_sp.AAC.1